MSNYYTAPQPDVSLLLYKAEKTLTDANIKAVTGGSSLFEIVPAPGVGKLLVPWSAAITYDFSGGAYTNIHATDAALDIRTGTFLNASSFIENSATRNLFTAMFSNADARTTILTGAASPGGSTSSLAAPAPTETSTVENQPINLEIYNGNGALTGGHANNTLKVVVVYLLLDI